MKRPLFIAIVGLLLCAGTWWFLYGGARKIARSYQKTDFAQGRDRVRSLQLMAADFEAQQKQPPEGQPAEFHIDFNDWGYPLQYGWEDGKAVLRAAGKDRKLHTDDDITSIVRIRKKEAGTSNNGVDPIR